MYLIPCPKCEADVLVPEERVGDVVRCDWCRFRFHSEGDPHRPTGDDLHEHICHRGSLHANMLIGLAVSNLILLGIASASVVKTPPAFRPDEYAGLVLFAGVVLVHLVASGVMVFGAVAFGRGRQHGLCVLATVLAMLPGCAVAFPIGILSGWPVLRFLLRPEVKRVFARNDPHADPDAG